MGGVPLPGENLEQGVFSYRYGSPYCLWKSKGGGSQRERKMIALSTWSLHRQFAQGEVDLFEFVKLAHQKYGVKGVEICHRHFSSLEAKYLKEMREKIEEEGLRLVNIPVDIGNISQPEEEKREEDLKKLLKWLEVAEKIGSPSLRVNSGEGPDISLTIQSYKRLVKEGERRKIKILIENHGGTSGNAENIVRIIEGVNSPYFWALPDFGNFPPGERYQSLKKILPYAWLIHAKTYEFDERGEEVNFDFGLCVKLCKEAKFFGFYSVEYEGKGEEEEGIKKTIALLKKYI